MSESDGPRAHEELMVYRPHAPHSCGLEGGLVKDLDDCARCGRERHDQLLVRQDRQECWTQAKNLLMSPDLTWADEGEPIPADILKLAKFLSGETDE